MVIRNTLEQAVITELLPRSQIDVYVQVGDAGQAGRQGRAHARAVRRDGESEARQAYARMRACVRACMRACVRACCRSPVSHLASMPEQQRPELAARANGSRQGQRAGAS